MDNLDDGNFILYFFFLFDLLHSYPNFIDSKRNHRLNQNRISAMKCRQKKKKQFTELMEKKDALEANNIKLKEKVSKHTISHFYLV